MPKWTKDRKKIMIPIKKYNEKTKEEETIFRYIWYPTKLSRKNSLLTVARKYCGAYGMKPSELLKEVKELAEEEGKPVLQCLNHEFLDNYYHRVQKKKKQKTSHLSDKINRTVYNKYMIESFCEKIIDDIIKSIQSKN